MTRFMLVMRSPSPLCLDELDEIPYAPEALLVEIHREAGKQISGFEDLVRDHALLRHRGEEKAPEEGGVLLLFRRPPVFRLIAPKVEVLDLAAGERLAQRLPVRAGVQLALFEYPADLRAPGRRGLHVVLSRLKDGDVAAQVSQGVDHLAEGVAVIDGVVFDDLLIIAPGGQIAVADEAVVRQVPRAPVAEVHDGVLAALEDAAVVDALVHVVGTAGAVVKGDGPLASVRKELVKPVGGVVDDQRGRAREIAVRPGVGQYVHGDARRLQASAPGKLHRVLEQRPVRAADQPDLVFIEPRGLLHRRVQIAGQEVEGGPDARDILQADEIGPRVHQFELELGRRGGERSLEAGQQRARTAVHKLRAVADLHAVLVGIPGKDGRAVGGVVVKIHLHRSALRHGAQLPDAQRGDDQLGQQGGRAQIDQHGDHVIQPGLFGNPVLHNITDPEQIADDVDEHDQGREDEISVLLPAPHALGPGPASDLQANAQIREHKQGHDDDGQEHNNREHLRIDLRIQIGKETRPEMQQAFDNAPHAEEDDAGPERDERHLASSQFLFHVFPPQSSTSDGICVFILPR